MLSLPIPASATPPVNANAPVVASDAAPASVVDGEGFSAVLARGLTANAEPKPGPVPTSTAESEDFSTLFTLGLPASESEPRPDAASAGTTDSEDFSAVLALGLAANAIEPKPDFAPATPAESASQSLPSGSEMVSLQIVAEPATVAVALLAPPVMMPTVAASSGIRPIQPERDGIGDSHQIPVTALSAAASSEISAPRNLPQATLPDRTAFDTDHMASFAAPGRSLPSFAAHENTSHTSLERQVTQPLPDSASASQTSYAPSAAAARLANADAAASPNLKLETRVGAPGWGGELAQKVAWMATRHQQVAELHLNPPQLGPVEVMLTIGNEPGSQANVQFASPHSAAREALEAALPRLREMLADSGIALGNATVSADSFQQRAEAGRDERASMTQAAARPETDTGFAGRAGVSLIRSGGNGLVDTFA